jgi:phosphohistidine phosphatase SixA
MVRSHLDSVVFNRLYNRLTGVPTTDAIRKHSFFLPDYNTALDVAADQQLAYLKNLKTRFSGVMHATHLPMAGNLLAFSHLPSIPPTLQSYWALAASRLKMLAFLCLAQSEYKRIDNRELTTIRTLMRMQQTRQVIRNNMGMEAFYEIAPYMDIAGIE